LSSGASKGAYQAGVIAQLVTGPDSDLFQWDVISGVSAGAINGAAVASFYKEEQTELSDFLGNFWQHKINNSNVKPDWDDGYILHPSRYDNKIQKEWGIDLIKELLPDNAQFKRKLSVGVTELLTMNGYTFKSYDLNAPLVS